MSSQLRVRIGALAVLAVAVVGSRVGAVPIAPGGGAGTPGTTVAARPELAGVTVADVFRPFSFVSGNIIVRGRLQDRVVRENVNGTLDFYYRVMLDAPSNVMIDAVRRDSFLPDWTPTDADWRIDGVGTKAPWMASRSVDGKWMTFNHTGAAFSIMPTESSRFVFVKTRAMQFNDGGSYVLHWRQGALGGNITVRAFQPVY